MNDIPIASPYFAAGPHKQIVRVAAAVQSDAQSFLGFLQRVGRRHGRPVRVSYRYHGRGRFQLVLDGGEDGVDSLLQELILNRGLFYYCCTLPRKERIVDGVVLPIFRQLIDERFQNPQSRLLRKHVLGKHVQTDFVPTDMRTPQVSVLGKNGYTFLVNLYVHRIEKALTLGLFRSKLYSNILHFCIHFCPKLTIQQLHLEITLQARRLDFTVLEPLSHLVRGGSDSNWCATKDSNP